MTITRREFVKQALTTAFAFTAGLLITAVKRAQPARKVPAVVPLRTWTWAVDGEWCDGLPFHVTFKDDRSIYEDIPTYRSMEGVDYKITWTARED